jgi:hypothetical protein
MLAPSDGSERAGHSKTFQIEGTEIVREIILVSGKNRH